MNVITRCLRVFVPCLVFLAGCSGSPELLPVPLPDMSRSDAPVRDQIREAHADALQKQQAGGARQALGQSFGELGMRLQAAEYFAAAEPAYLNAQRLLPVDRRWPYLLGHVYRDLGSLDKSIESFERALELRRSPDVATLVWIARAHLALGRAAEAEATFERARSIEPRAPAVLAGLGQAALARGEHRRATDLLQEALVVQPQAAGLHAPLASAYRALGDTAKADVHAKQWKNVDVSLNDPLTDQLAAILRSAVSFELRGVRAFDAGDWAGAARVYREGLTLTAADSPVGRSLRHKLGIALYLGGDARGGIEQWEEAVRLAPAAGHDEPAARAHYSLGIIMGSSGKDDRAVDHLSRAVEYDATSQTARIALADALRRTRRDAAALPHYQQAVAIDPQAASARLSYALALIRLRRYADARLWLEDSVRAQPDRPELAHALARLLAAAPDVRVRDAERAGAIVGELLETSKRTEIGETMAMALAELGQFNEALGIQRGVMDAARRAGLQDDVKRMAANLKQYEQRQPSRVPWPDDDPIHRPGPPISPQLAALIGR